MTVRQIETEMPAGELAEWFGHFHLSKLEAEKARKDAEAKAKSKR